MLLQLGCKWEIGSPVTSTEFSGEKVEREGMVWAVAILSARLKFSQAHVALLSPRPQLEYCGPRASTGASGDLGPWLSYGSKGSYYLGVLFLQNCIENHY